MKKAFTIIELVFVIVILGILAGVAIPKLAVTRDDATISKLRADVAAIRSGLALKRQQELLQGTTTWPDLGEKFSNVLSTPLKLNGTRNGWKPGTANNGGTAGFEACVSGQCTTFTYYKNAVGKAGTAGYIAAGTFSCPDTDSTCQKLTD